MSKNPRGNRPYFPRINRIELSERNVRARWVLLAVFLAIAAVSIGYGLNTVINTQPGWNEIAVVSDQPNCSSEFKLVYDFSETGRDALSVEKKLKEVYVTACEDAFALFTTDAELDRQNNLQYLNNHINIPVSVDSVLYNALELLSQHKNRSLFLAPVYAEYNRVFLSGSDEEAALHDPQKNPEVAEYVDSIMTYVCDPQHIRLELLGNNQVQLYVSEMYRSFAEENGIENYLDFGWLKNAFVVDYLADVLMEHGFTEGYLASFDGFTRNLDQRGNFYTINFFDRIENTIYLPAEVTYIGGNSIVCLRDYPLTAQDQWRYRVYEDGTISSVLLNPNTGWTSAATDSWMTMSNDSGCASMLLNMLDIYFAEEFTAEKVQTLAEQGIGSVWCEDRTVYSNIPNAQVTLLDTGVNAGYEIELVK